MAENSSQMLSDWDRPLSETEIARLSPAALAYLGDAVYELHVRRSMLFPPRRLKDYHRATVDRVRATAQAHLLDSLWLELRDPERAIAQRGRNTCGRGPRHLDAKLYQQASAFETVLGYLFVTDRERLAGLLARCDDLARPV